MRSILFVLLILFIASCSAKAPPRQTTTQIPSEEQKSAAAIKEERRKKKQAEAKKKEKEELRKLIEDAQPIIANILAAVDKTDHERFIRDFNASFKETNKSKKRFVRGNTRRKERLGDLVGRKFWKVEKRNPFYTLFYKVKFTKVDDPIEVRLVVERVKNEAGQRTGEMKVTLVQFISPALQN